MTENDIAGLGLAIEQAVVDQDDAALKQHAMRLAWNFLVDFNRIATALEELAKVEIERKKEGR